MVVVGRGVYEGKISQRKESESGFAKLVCFVLYCFFLYSLWCSMFMELVLGLCLFFFFRETATVYVQYG